MHVTYSEAVEVLRREASSSLASFTRKGESIAIQNAIGRICFEDVWSDCVTPPFDTSAMDGYAIRSAATATASAAAPCKFNVRGTIAAGETPVPVSGAVEDGMHPCCEIMTGARFPESDGDYEFDACVRVEDTDVLPCSEDRCIEIKAPVPAYANRRRKGSDFRKGDLVVARSSMILPQHILALASLGLFSVTVLRKPRIALWSTGDEISASISREQSNERIMDANGPFLSAVLADAGAEVDFLGVIPDSVDNFTKQIEAATSNPSYDMLVTTGGVSAGRFDFVREGLERLGATVLFHHVAIRPGHPILFAKLVGVDGLGMNGHAKDGRHSSPFFFGLPGNPLASIAGFRFFILPFLRFMSETPAERPFYARMKAAKTGSLSRIQLNGRLEILCSSPVHLDVFRHGVMRQGLDGIEAEISHDQGASKTKPLLGSDCWVLIPRGHGKVFEGDVLPCFPLFPGAGRANGACSMLTA